MKSEQGFFIFIKQFIIDLKKPKTMLQPIINDSIPFQLWIKLSHAAQLQQLLGFLYACTQTVTQA